MKRKNPAESCRADICVIGGGMAGICAAVAAARNGAKVILVHDRPVLGGNASSEVKMWIRGAGINFPLYREGGLIEEIAMRNIHFNPAMSYAGWDGVLYDFVCSEPNVRLFLNASCCDAEEKNGRIVRIRVWQLTTYKKFDIEAEFFIDCSGDCILAEFTSAEYMTGREGKERYREQDAPLVADLRTMGNSCLLQVRETEKEVPFIPPTFARKFTDEDFNHRLDIRNPKAFVSDNFWWIELGGERNTLSDAESINADLLAAAYGVWDYIKNSGRFDSSCWALDWVGFLGAKRESRRYRGDYVLNENDIMTSAFFSDEVAYGGWSMDDHDPRGLTTLDPPNRNVTFDKPYAIPYRCLYSVNIENLFFAGRNVSVTHMALTSTRVMATCALMGQAVGTAACMALKLGVSVREMSKYIGELQQELRDKDCYLLHVPRRVSREIREAIHNLDKENFEKMKAGIERKVEFKDYSIRLPIGTRLEFCFPKTYCRAVRLLLDNDIARETVKSFNLKQYPQKLNITRNDEWAEIPEVLTKSFEVFIKKNGEWHLIEKKKDNYFRLIEVKVDEEIEGIGFIGRSTYGSPEICLLSLDIIK